MSHNKRNKKTFFATFLTSTGGIFLFCSLLFFIFNSSFLTTLAAPDLEMTYHGKLTDTSNVAVADGNYDFTITIYDAASNGTCLWTARGSCGTPTAKSLTVTNGIFSTTLGESGDNALDLDFSANYWLDIKISTNPSMTPRRKITPTGFALNSHRFNGLTADNYLDTSATTQTKAGALTINNILTVNDNLTVNSGNVGFSNTTSQVLTRTAESGYVRTTTYSSNDTNWQGGYDIAMRSGNTNASPTSVLNGWTLARYSGRGYKDSEYSILDNAYLSLVAEGDFSDTSTPAAFTVGTTPSGSTTPVERFRINNAGRVGIGTTDPQDLVHISSTSSNANLRISTSDNTMRAKVDVKSPINGVDLGGALISLGENNTDFGAGTGGNVVLQTNGNFTSVPAGKGNLLIHSRNDDAYLGFHTGSSSLIGSERMRITSAGDVGIGTTLPTADLTIEDTDHNAEIHIKNIGGSSAVYPGMAIYSYDNGYSGSPGISGYRADGTESTPLVARTDVGMFSVSGRAYDGSSFVTSAKMDFLTGPNYANGDEEGLISFSVADGGVLSEAMRINYDSNVGIGTTIPSYKLDVDGDGRFTGSASVGRGIADTYQFAVEGIKAGTVGSIDYQRAIFAGVYPNPSLWTEIEHYASGLTAAALTNSQITVSDTLDYLYGSLVQYGTYTGTAGTVENATGLRIEPYRMAGTVDDQYDLYITDVSGSGTLTNTHYSIYQENTNATNYFAGDVGIGTTDPDAKVDIGTNNILTLDETTTGTEGFIGWGAYHNGSTIRAQGATYHGFAASVVRAASASKLHFKSYDSGGSISDLMTMQYNGNIGIGTTNPTEELNIAATDDFPVVRLEGFSATSHTSHVIGSAARGSQSLPSATQDTDTLFVLRAQGYGATGYVATNTGSAQIVMSAEENFTDATAAGRISFHTTPTGSTTAVERMTILGSGYVGIGDATPSYELDVDGSGRFMDSLGVGMVPSDLYQLTVLSTKAGASGSTDYERGIYAGVRPDPSLWTQTSHQATGIVSSVLTNSQLTASDTIDYIYGIIAQHGAFTDTAGTITNSYGVRIEPYRIAGTVDNQYDLYINDVSGSGTITNTHYSIYQEDSNTTNYFAGEMGIGTSNPNELLQVNGAINIGTTTNTNAGTIRWNGSDFQGYTGSAWASLTASGASSIWDADTDTGIQVEESTDDDIIRFDTAGTERMTIDSFGNLIPSAVETYNLGSSSYRWQDLYLGPESLHIGSSTTDEGIISYNTTSNIFGIATDATTQGDIAFNTNDLYIDTSLGLVGIGLTAPAQALHVNGNAIIRTEGEVGLQFGYDTENPDWSIIRPRNYGATTTNGVLITNDGDTPILSAGVGGNIGIGTTSPPSRVSIGGNSYISPVGVADPSLVMQFDNTFDNDGYTTANKIIFHDQADSWRAGLGVSSGDLDFFSGSNFRFYTSHHSSAQGTEALTVLTSGNVGIGIDSPGYKLHVAGDGRFTDRLQVIRNDLNDLDVQFGNWVDEGDAVTGFHGVHIGRDMTNRENFLRTSGDNANSRLYFQHYSYQSGTTTDVGSFDRYAFRTNINTYLATDSGSVGIGTTIPSYKLDVDGSGRFTDSLGVGMTVNTTYQLAVDAIKAGASGSIDYQRAIYGGVQPDPSLWTETTHYATSVTASSLTNSLLTASDTIDYLQGIAVQHGAYIDTAGTITNSYGVRIAPYRRAGTVDNQYDLYIDDVSGSGTLTNTHYSIYQESPNTTNYFAGYVGIGTDTPGSKLHIGESGDTDKLGILRVLNTEATTAGRYTSMIVGQSLALGGAGSLGYVSDTTTPANAAMYLANYGDVETTAGLWIERGGEVGIGTSTPAAKLDVAGITHVGVDQGNDFLSVAPYAENNFAYISARETPFSPGTTKMILQTFNSGVSNSALIIDNLGNVGIGNSAPSYALDVTGSGRFTDSLGVGTTTSNTYQFAARAIKAGVSGSVDYQRAIFATVDPDSTLWTQTSHNATGIMSSVLTDGSITGSDTLDSLQGITVQHGAYDGTAGTITNSFGLRIVPYRRAGTIDNQYDLYISTPSIGGTLTNTHYSIYQESTSTTNYFAGEMGIGTTNPNELLQVNGAINIGTTTNTNAGTIRWNGSDFQGYTGSAWASLTASGASSIWDADTDTGIQVEESTDDDIIRFDTAGTERMTIDSFGNLIPSAVETYNLGSSSYRWQDLYLGPESLHIGSSTTDEGIISYNTTSNIFGIATDATTQGDIAFNTNDLYIDTSLNRVGIGTDSPSEALEVVGVIRANSHVESGSGSGSVALTTNDGYGNANISFNHRAGTPDTSGSANRIETSVDGTTGSFSFEIGDNVISGTPTGLTQVLAMTTSAIDAQANLDANAGIDVTGSLAMLGTSSNIALGSNWLSGDGGDEGVFVDSGGDVGIGTTNPDANFHVYSTSGNIGSTGIAGAAITGSGWQGLALDGTASNKSLILHYGGVAGNELRFGRFGDNLGAWESNVVTIDMDAPGNSFVVADDGDVGIGHGLPSYDLHVSGDGYFTDSAGIGMEPNSLYQLAVMNSDKVGVSGSGDYQRAIYAAVDPRASRWTQTTHSATGISVSVRTDSSITASDTLNTLYGIGIQYGANSGTLGTISAATGMRIMPNRVAGTITNQYDLFIANPATGGTLTGTHFSIYQQSANTTNYFAGDTGIGDSSPAYKLEIGGGDVNTTAGGYRDAGTCVAGTCASDSRLKENIEPITGSLEKLLQITPSTFTFIDTQYGSTDINHGFIAQELETVYPDWVIEDEEDGYKRVRYGLNLQMATINAIQEQNQLITTNTNDLTTKADMNSLTDLQTLVGEIPDQVRDDVSAELFISTRTDAEEGETLRDDILLLQTEANTLSDNIEAIETRLDATDAGLAILELLGATELTTLETLLAVDPEKLVYTDEEGNLTIESIITATTIKAESIETNTLVINDDVTEEDGDGDEVSAASIGTTTIEAGEESITIETTAVTEGSRVFVSPKEPLDQTLAATDIVVGESFTVELLEAREEDLEVDWFIIGSGE